ncbi:MAG: peptidoglycan DD-metalloendopeptidase family protein [Bacteroidales bacterium]|jgi:septal ring factor EnvC (AmiA/AmiB activator)|nr:peptidoglycan DD-metalloendopeptidase family protein [Bacteroidales bacterium]MCI2121273.1 peptidoglycan DD-metalloendopeptidase family protein [Bacteroidales bacterium]MCI2146131.1 peptidoglycan DD-metalloendopeptidase family protein [Bacteroidales bacterium]
MKRVICFLTAFFVCIASSYAQTIEEHNARKKKIQEEISAIDNQLKDNREAQKVTTGKLTLVQKKISSRKLLLREIDAQIDDYSRSIAAKEDEIMELQAERDTLGKYYDNLILSLYKNRDPRILFMYVLASKDIGQSFRRFTYLKNLSVTIRGKAADIDDKEAEIDAEKARLETLKEKANDVRNQRKGEYAAMLREEEESREIVQQLKGREREYRRQIAAKQKEIKRLDDEIAKVVRQTIRSDRQNRKTDYALSGRFEQNKGKLPWPVDKGVVIEKYGQHRHPVYKNVRLPFNNGVNILAGGSPEVHCVFDGTVKQILVMPGYNQCVLVQHGTYFTFYCKLAGVVVKNGEPVSAGQVIGTVAKNEYGQPVLHFQIWNGMVKQNPEDWLR